MSAVKQILAENKRRARVDEFLSRELARAGYGGMDMVKTPLGTRITIYAVRPGLVIGRGGENIKRLARMLEEKFGLFNPQIAVAEVQVPELNPYIMASKIASALERGVHFRRACYWALNSIMNAGALGCEIIISGKLTTERARYEKFRAGYLPKVGDPVLKQVRRAVAYTLLKPGLYGIQVTIVPPDYTSPDYVKIKEPPSELLQPEEKAEEAEEALEAEKAEEAAVEGGEKAEVKEAEEEEAEDASSKG
ncbi:30S ribosomal protein S3 [Candidatus Bathyarchaeota archaeon]|nr:MAG: 30S ribosomal protein S3 [Candidatus Bathyarchaeota archaeon]